MIVDSSALVAIIKEEPLAPKCLQAMEQASHLIISAANYVEVSIVADSSEDPRVAVEFDRLVREYNIIIEPVSVSQAELARRTHHRYGRGHDSRARLNFGDCFAYALAREKNEPLLFVGNDFSHTDIIPALS